MVRATVRTIIDGKVSLVVMRAINSAPSDLRGLSAIGKPRSLPLQGFAAETARDWLDLLIRAQPDTPRDVAEATATRTLALIRGLLLDLLADEESGRVAAAVQAGTWQPA